jgi:hypothetical protein
MSKGNVQVIYNGNVISPTPFVSRVENAIDYGHRWGVSDAITLKGLYPTSGLISGVIPQFLNLFSGDFARFSVIDTGEHVTVLDYPHVILEEISFDSNHFFPNTYVPYTVKLKNINVPSGVTEPVNEYSFVQNEDGTVTVNHRVSAKGVVTSDSFDSALQNAVTFVSAFTGFLPFNPVFVSFGSGVLLSQSESLDRLTSVYSVAEVFKYNSGESLPYVYTHSLDIDESPDSDYVTMSLKYNRQGSSITSNLEALRVGLEGFDVVGFLSSQYGIGNADCYINNLNVVESSGKNNIQINASIVSGVGDEFNGFFDFDLDMRWDRVMDVKQFSLNGKFISKAPISLRKTFLNTFKTNVTTAYGDYRNYVYSLITGESPNMGVSLRSLNPIPTSLSINENTGLAELSITATFNDKDFLDGIGESSFNASFDVPKNIYEFKPSANIEGNYIIQDLQTNTRETLKLTSSFKTTGNMDYALSNGPQVLTQIGNQVLSNFFLTESGFSTGVFDLDINASYLNSGSVFGLDTRYYLSSNPSSIRPPGYKYGL